MRPLDSSDYHWEIIWITVRITLCVLVCWCSLNLNSVFVQVQFLCQLLPQLDAGVTVDLKHCFQDTHLHTHTHTRVKRPAAGSWTAPVVYLTDCWSTWLLVKAVRGLRPTYQFDVDLGDFGRWEQCCRCCLERTLSLLSSFSGSISGQSKLCVIKCIE